MTHPSPSPDPDPMPTPLPTPTPFVELCRLTIEGGPHYGATMRAWLAYDPADPHAAKLTIESSEGMVEWVLARDLLRGGLIEPTGLGDVRAFPLGLAHFGIRFSSPDGEFFVSVARSVVARWVHRSYAMVPDGAERFDADAWLNGVLTAT